MARHGSIIASMAVSVVGMVLSHLFASQRSYPSSAPSSSVAISSPTRTLSAAGVLSRSAPTLFRSKGRSSPAALSPRNLNVPLSFFLSINRPLYSPTVMYLYSMALTSSLSVLPSRLGGRRRPGISKHTTSWHTGLLQRIPLSSHTSNLDDIMGRT